VINIGTTTLEDAGGEGRPAEPDYAERDRSIIDTYLGGKSLAQTGLEHGVNTNAVRQILIRNNIERRPQGTRERNLIPSERDRSVIAMYRSGRSLEQTGAKYANLCEKSAVGRPAAVLSSSRARQVADGVSPRQ
jgi:hypothetical protein